MNDEDLRKRFEEIVETVTDRTCLVRFQNPPSAGAHGEVWKPEEAPGLCMIDIIPDGDYMKRYKWFLHELAHILLGHLDKAPVTPDLMQRPGAYKPTKHYWDVEHKTDKKEISADELVEKMDAWAWDRVWELITPNTARETLLIMKLAALKFFRMRWIE